MPKDLKVRANEINAVFGVAFFLTMMTRSHGGHVFPVVKAEVRDLGSWITFLTPFDTTHHLIASLPIYLP